MGVHMKVLIKEKEKAIILRKQGMSINNISTQLKRPKSSISYWVRNVELTEDQKRYLESKNPVTNNVLRNRAIEKNRVIWMERRKKYQEEGKKLVSTQDPGFIAGLMLFWAEGAKNKNSVQFSNTDVNMVKFFINFLRKYFEIKNDKVSLKINCHLNNGLTIDHIENYWLTVLGLEKDNLNKSYIEQKRKVSGKRKNVHLHGVCTIAVHSTEIVQKMYGAIKAYVGFEEETWIK
jgi:uncharacterized DUF497 family protein